MTDCYISRFLQRNNRHKCIAAMHGGEIISIEGAFLGKRQLGRPIDCPGSYRLPQQRR